ncbi:sensor histidine kinase [Streptomyces zagrosensis]|uniref:histidine kinase n=1 Tax=Streptomyces zagrosensis TaxID=1042984 RepID=A0A7W9QCK0_9ACTN|nr:histidine kinase [Streptomyces zagrosensis]MBB5937700.1 signal transduction histidine kinase [Streptomyces zagrosensis]
MRKTRGLLLPGVFALTQLLLWFIAVPTLSEPPSPTMWITAFIATAVTAHALERRNRTPLPALGEIVASSVLVQVLAPPDTLNLVASVAVLMALFSVTVRSDWIIGLGATAAAAVVQLLLGAAQYGFGSALVFDWLVTVCLYLPACALGAGRRHWLRERQVTKQRLTSAELELGQAVDTERNRLANELHDISAHHLTSVVVSVEAARRLGASRPELATEALTFASRTARETQVALRRLVTVMGVDEVPAPQSMTASIEALIAGFGRLGRPVSVRLPADLVGPAAEAAHGIVREALTNALRYAPGASVAIRAERAGEALHLTIDNSRPPGGVGGDKLGIGSGRGLDGMCRRAAAIGGHLSAGPRPDGGWRVAAVLPDARSARQPATGRRRNFTREQRIADGAVFGSVAVASSGYALQKVADAGHGVSVWLLLTLLLTVHALPLLWRRRAPWLALAVVGATVLVWPGLLQSGVLPPSIANGLLGGGLAELAAVYGVAAYGRVLKRAATPAQRYGPPLAPQLTYPPGYRLSYLSVPAAALSFGVPMTVAFAADGLLLGEPTHPFLLLFLLAEVLLGLGLVFTAAWWAGWLMHMRRKRVLEREDAALTGLLSSTRDMVHSERQRVAGGLQEKVLQQTTLVISSAEAGSLSDVAAATRATLAAMRQLLGSLDAGKAPTAPRKAPAQTAPRA